MYAPLLDVIDMTLQGFEQHEHGDEKTVSPLLSGI